MTGNGSVDALATIEVFDLRKVFRIAAPRSGTGRGLARVRRSRVEHTALDDVSFRVHDGEILGIVGRNGAGKSTLLKILSRITVPTSGRAVIRGRVAALLEVGTGMHPEMSGRENVYLNGALLGMDRATVHRRLEQIVEFAGVERYLDTALKHYSSGMKVRLAFAVAAHLDSDVLIVDEVLAVGDAEFQARCLGTMRDSIRSGRTVLYVSHNLPSVENLCTSVLWLDGGRIRALGEPTDVCRSYVGEATRSASVARWVATEAGVAPPSDPVGISSVSIDGAGAGAGVVQGEDIIVHVEVVAAVPVRGLQLLVALRTLDGVPVLTSCNGDTRDEWNLDAGRWTLEVRLIGPRLLPRTHVASVSLIRDWGRDRFDEVIDAVRFDVHEGDVFGRGVVAKADRGTTWTPASYTARRSGTDRADIASTMARLEG